MQRTEPMVDSLAVAEHLQVPKGTLDQWAYLGRGPKYVKVGRHRRYRWSDVEQWLNENTRGGGAA